MVYLISYDLNRPGQGYARLYDGIKELGAWWHYLDSTWLVDTNLTSRQIFERLRSRIDANDRLLIIGVTRDYSGWLPGDAWNWINGCARAAA